MKYYATIEGQTYEIAIDGPDQISINGVPVMADMQTVGRQDLYSLLLDQTSHEVEVEAESGMRGQFDVLVSGTRYVVKVQDERARRLTGAERKAQPAAGESSVRAPIPGLIVKVLVTPGQVVAEGETLVILEAMKMENDVRAPHAGTVHEVRVTPGMQVALGQVLVSVRSKAEG
jgi:biotin carboxyl carrier protein